MKGVIPTAVTIPANIPMDGADLTVSSWELRAGELANAIAAQDDNPTLTRCKPTHVIRRTVRSGNGMIMMGAILNGR